MLEAIFYNSCEKYGLNIAKFWSLKSGIENEVEVFDLRSSIETKLGEYDGLQFFFQSKVLNMQKVFKSYRKCGSIFFLLSRKKKNHQLVLFFFQYFAELYSQNTFTEYRLHCKMTSANIKYQQMKGKMKQKTVAKLSFFECKV